MEYPSSEDPAYSSEVGKRYLKKDYDLAVRILERVSRWDIKPEEHRVLVPRMYRKIARAIGDARNEVLSAKSQ